MLHKNEMQASRNQQGHPHEGPSVIQASQATCWQHHTMKEKDANTFNCLSSDFTSSLSKEWSSLNLRWMCKNKGIKYSRHCQLIKFLYLKYVRNVPHEHVQLAHKVPEPPRPCLVQQGEWSSWHQVAHQIWNHGTFDSRVSKNMIWSSFDISAMSAIPRELAFKHDVAIMSVERHGFLQVLCLLPFIFIIFYRY